MSLHFIKDPNAVLDYTFDWSDWLGVDTIGGTPTVTVPAGITKDSQSNDTTSVTVVLSGGTAGETYAIHCRIVTAGGLTDDRTIIVKVEEK